jgi:hypothetical protein
MVFSLYFHNSTISRPALRVPWGVDPIEDFMNSGSPNGCQRQSNCGRRTHTGLAIIGHQNADGFLNFILPHNLWARSSHSTAIGYATPSIKERHNFDPCSNARLARQRHTRASVCQALLDTEQTNPFAVGHAGAQRLGVKAPARIFHHHPHPIILFPRYFHADTRATGMLARIKKQFPHRLEKQDAQAFRLRLGPAVDAEVHRKAMQFGHAPGQPLQGRAQTRPVQDGGT